MGFLLVDRILETSSGIKVTGQKYIDQHDHYLLTANSGQHYFPLSLVGETLGQLAAWNAMSYCDFKYRPVAGVVHSVIFYRPPLVAEKIIFEACIDTIDNSAIQYNGYAKIGNEVILKLDGAIGPMLPMEEFIDPNIAKSQYDLLFNKVLEKPTQKNNNLPISTLAENIFGVDLVSINSAEKKITATKKVLSNSIFLPDHFPKKPVYPLTILLENSMQLAYKFLQELGIEEDYKITELRKIKISNFIVPDDTLYFEISIKSVNLNQYCLLVKISVAEKKICSFELIVIR